LTFKIHDIQDTEFSGGFLLALSASVKELVIGSDEESALRSNAHAGKRIKKAGHA
jgi:hypothetical protein